jgi:hypothetical protein
MVAASDESLAREILDDARRRGDADDGEDGDGAGTAR